MHRAERRRTRALVPDVRGAGRGMPNPHRGGLGERRRAAPAAAGVYREPRFAMWVLHAWIPHAGDRRSRARAQHQRRGPDRRFGVESLPLHRLREYRESGPCRRRQDGRRPMTAGNNKCIGQSVERLEDPPLVRGRGRFAADISFPHQLHMRIVRANHAHGRIAAIDASAARALPGVVAVWSAADIADIPSIDFREGRIPALEPYRQPVLATDKVRYVGDPVAAVFARDAYVAEDAADLVEIAIDELPVLLAAEAEPGEFAPGRNTEVSIIRQGYGDVDAALRAAPITVELELAIGRHSGVPLEARGGIARYDAARDIL